MIISLLLITFLHVNDTVRRISFLVTPKSGCISSKLINNNVAQRWYKPSSVLPVTLLNDRKAFEIQGGVKAKKAVALLTKLADSLCSLLYKG